VGSGNTSPVSQTAHPGRRSSLHADLCSTVAAEGAPNYPKFKKSREKFLKECADAKSSGDYTKLVQFYGTAFQNFANLNAVFKVSYGRSLAAALNQCCQLLLKNFWQINQKVRTRATNSAPQKVFS
jgi:hypothetical protein